MKNKAKALVMFSGGLDSMLAARLLQDQGIRTDGFFFRTPFSDPGIPVKSAGYMELELHVSRAGKGYFNLIRNPGHGYGANMNPCLDCRVHMMRRAKACARRTRADFIATGEVLGERPMSQTKDSMLLIEREAGLEGRVVRPLSARLMPVTEAESEGLVKREALLDIQGRTRRRQMELARKLGIREYPGPGGGCLLTDPGYSRRLREFLKYSGNLEWKDAELLKLGRHFRYGKGKIIVGRDQEENRRLMELARRHRLPWMEVRDHPGPVTVLQGFTWNLADNAAALTVLYSDATYKKTELSLFVGGKERTLISGPINKREFDKLRII